MNERNWKLDLFKFVGIISVFWGHVTEWFFFDTNAKLLKDYPKESFQYYLPEFSINYVLVICISLVFSAGMSLYWSNKQYQTLSIKLNINHVGWKKIWKRFFVLFVGATTINLFNIQYHELDIKNDSIIEMLLGLGEELVYTDVFHLVAIGTLVLPSILKYLKISHLWVFSLLIFCFQQPIINLMENLLPYEQIDSPILLFVYNFLIGNYAGDSYYPIFPWLALFSLGYYAGYIEDFKKNKLKIIFTILGVLLLIFVPNNKSLIINPENLWGAQIYVPSMFDFLGITGIIILEYRLIFSLPEKWKSVLFSKNSPIRVYSQAILFAFIFHSVFMYQIISYFVPLLNNNLNYFYLVQIIQFLLTYIASLLWLKIKEPKHVDI